jgi:stage II sporulation protein D
MKLYVWLGAICYVLLMLIPLPLLPASQEEPADTVPTTSTTVPAPDEPEEPKKTFTILDASAGVIYTFEQRDFLIYTVAAEMPASYHTEALKAQAVATYTYYMYEKRHNEDSKELQGADSSQVPASFPATYSPQGLKEKWGEDYDTHLKTIAAAVDSVMGKCLTYEGEPILAVYHHGNWGRTETAGIVWGTDYPYLQ